MNSSRLAPDIDNFVLRPATLSDAPALAALEEQLFGGEAWSQTLLEAELNSPEDRSFLVVAPQTAPEELAGYGEIWVGDGRGDADILTIATAASWQRRGVGRRLLETMIAIAWDAGCQSVLLEVRASNAAAQSLYTRVGFETLGKRRNYYQNPPEDALVMRLYNPKTRVGAVGSEVADQPKQNS